MGRNRFPPQEVTRIPLSDGDWIEIKTNLNSGDAKIVEHAGEMLPVKDANGNFLVPIDWAVFEYTRAAIYLTDWSFRGADDKPVPLRNKSGVVSVDTLKAMDAESFAEVNEAISLHVKRQVEAKKAARRLSEQLLKQAEEASQAEESASAMTSGS